MTTEEERRARIKQRGDNAVSFRRADYERTFAFAAKVYSKTRDKALKHEAVELMAAVERVVGQLTSDYDPFNSALIEEHIRTGFLSKVNHD